MQREKDGTEIPDIFIPLSNLGLIISVAKSQK